MFFKLSRHFNLTAIKSKSRANDLPIRHGNALKLRSCRFVAAFAVTILPLSLPQRKHGTPSEVRNSQIWLFPLPTDKQMNSSNRSRHNRSVAAETGACYCYWKGFLILILILHPHPCARSPVHANEAMPLKSRPASQSLIKALQSCSCYVTRLAGDLQASFHPAINAKTRKKKSHVRGHTLEPVTPTN